MDYTFDRMVNEIREKLKDPEFPIAKIQEKVSMNEWILTLSLVRSAMEIGKEQELEVWKMSVLIFAEELK